MRSLRAHLELERPQRVVAIREKGNVLVHLQALRVQHLIQASFRLRIKRLHKTKAFAGGALVVFIFSKAQCTLTHNNLDVVLLREPVAHVPPVHADLEAPSGRGKRSLSPGLPSIKHGCSSPNSASRRLATLRVSYRTVLTSSVTSRGRKSLSASR